MKMKKRYTSPKFELEIFTRRYDLLTNPSGTYDDYGDEDDDTTASAKGNPGAWVDF